MGGVYDAGVYDLTPAATVILRRKSSGKAITTDVLLLEPATQGTKLLGRDRIFAVR